MRTKVTLLLLFLNVALFVFIFKFERSWRTDQSQRETRRRVLGPEAASIQHLRISGPGLSTIELVRTGQQWTLTSPINWPANPHAVNRILNELQFLEHETSFSVAELERNNQSLADYGLAPPRLTIEFTPASPNETSNTVSDTQQITLYVGDETKVGNRLYLLSPQRDRVHVVGLSLARSLNLPLEELRTDNVFSIPLFEARSLNLQNATASRVRIRQEGKYWNFEAPIIARANKPQVELAISALASLRVHHFLPSITSVPALSAPTTNAELRISLVGNNRQETLLLLNEVEPTTAERKSLNEEDAAPTASGSVAFIATLERKTTRFVVEVPSPLLNTLRNAQDTLREPRILDFEPEALTAVTLSAPDQAPLTLQQLRSSAEGQNTWQIVRRSTEQSPQLQPVDPKRMQELIQMLRRLAALRFVSDAPSDADLEAWGFNRPEREITLTLTPSANALSATGAGSREEPQTLRLQLGLPSQPGSHAYARLSSARFVYQIPAALLDQTTPDPLQYRQRLLRDLPEAARFHSLTITDLRDTSTVFETHSPEPSANTDPSPPLTTDKNTGASAVDTLFAALRHLEAESFIQDHFSESVFAAGAERLWRWRIDCTVRLPDGRNDEQSEVTQLFLTERLGGNLQLAGSPELGLIFAINQELLDALWQLSYRERIPAADHSPAPTPSSPDPQDGTAGDTAVDEASPTTPPTEDESLPPAE